MIRLGRLITNQVHQRMAPEDQFLVGHNMGILTDLSEKDGVRQQDLAVSSIKDKATITRGLQSLEKEGLVLRTADPVDRRTKRIYITPKGRKVVQRVMPLAHEVMAGARESISPEDLATCERVMRQLYENLNS